MDRQKKSEVVLSLKEELTNNSLIVLVHYRGLNAADITNLRKSLKDKGATLQVAKNTLMKLALKDTQCDCLNEYLTGPTAVSYSKDPVGLSKVLTTFVNENKTLKILIGCLDGKSVDESVLKSLAKLGSLEEVRAKFVGVLTGVPSKLLQLVNAPSSKLVTILGNYIDSKK
jgi:large subunit ribosomal protein L10